MTSWLIRSRHKELNNSMSCRGRCEIHPHRPYLPAPCRGAAARQTAAQAAAAPAAARAAAPGCGLETGDPFSGQQLGDQEHSVPAAWSRDLPGQDMPGADHVQTSTLCTLSASQDSIVILTEQLIRFGQLVRHGRLVRRAGQQHKKGEGTRRSGAAGGGVSCLREGGRRLQRRCPGSARTGGTAKGTAKSCTIRFFDGTIVFS